VIIIARRICIIFILASLATTTATRAADPDGASLARSAAALESSGKYGEAAEAYGKAATAFEGEGKQAEQTKALEKSAEMYEKLAEQLTGGSTAAPAASAAPTRAAPSTAATPDRSQDRAKLKAALGAVSLWLKLIDNGNFGESFDSSSATFKNGLTKEKWESTMQTERAPLGKPTERELKAADQQDDKPGTPIKFRLECEFAGGKALTEIVTAEVETDGQWRVSDYSIESKAK
jgi:hypothetical protein